MREAHKRPSIAALSSSGVSPCDRCTVACASRFLVRCARSCCTQVPLPRRGSLLRVPVPAQVRATATQRGLPSGFGARVMERIIPGQLNGELKFEWRV